MYCIGIDLGGTKIRIGLFYNHNLVVKKEALTQAHRGPKQVILTMYSLIDEILSEQNLSVYDLEGIGIGCPGPLNPWTGVILSPPNLPGWNGVQLKKMFEQHYNRPTVVHNDANAAALGEFLHTDAPIQNLVYMTLSTGIGGGIISDGKLLLGKDGSAGEIGHMVIMNDGPQCNCGRNGCLESLVSGESIARRFNQIKSEQGYAKSYSTKDVFTLASTGDYDACHLLSIVQDELAIGITNVIHMYNPEKLVLGGGVTQAGDYFLMPVIQKAIEKTLSGMESGLVIETTSFGTDLGLIGAGALVSYELNKSSIYK